ncbi:hypothetical protein ACLEE4_01730 [Lonsdalea quercina]|uniref:hypothetical protein n=1 Tax=Lonsdalea quercina TaxID=71657 RepID=UPI0039762AF9
MKKLLLIACMSLLIGCAYVGKNFDESKLAGVEKGKTTKQDLITSFGEPTTMTVDSEGNELLMWSYSMGSAFGANAKVLMIKTKNGKVESYTVSKSKI